MFKRKCRFCQSTDIDIEDISYREAHRKVGLRVVRCNNCEAEYETGSGVFRLLGNAPRPPLSGIITDYDNVE